MKKIEALAERVKEGEASHSQALGEFGRWWQGQQPEKGGHDAH